MTDFRPVIHPNLSCFRLIVEKIVCGTYLVAWSTNPHFTLVIQLHIFQWRRIVSNASIITNLRSFLSSTAFAAYHHQTWTSQNKPHHTTRFPSHCTNTTTSTAFIIHITRNQIPRKRKLSSRCASVHRPSAWRAGVNRSVSSLIKSIVFASIRLPPPFLAGGSKRTPKGTFTRQIGEKEVKIYQGSSVG
jgi:hypothetical protein